nr:preprotein translocase subunit SecY [Synarthrophyton patena]
MLPYKFYLSEFITRIIYILLSYFICLYVYIINIDNIFLFEIYPFIVFTKKRFIVTQITDFIDVIWYLSLFMTTLFIFPFWLYHVKSYFMVGWYKYQINLIKNLLIFKIFFFLFIFFLTHTFFLPFVFKFFLQWEVTNAVSLLRIESEVSILPYIHWILNFKIIFAYFFSFLILLIKIIFQFLEISFLYTFIKLSKNICIFLFTFFTYLLLPPDFFIQFTIICINIITFNFLFLFLCLQLYKINSIKK